MTEKEYGRMMSAVSRCRSAEYEGYVLSEKTDEICHTQTEVTSITDEQRDCINCIFYADDSLFDKATCLHLEANSKVYNNSELVIDENWQCQYFNPGF